MYSVLMIDDDVELLRINEKYFSGRGYEVHTASGAAEGVALLDALPVDCILLDVMMPGVDGLDACKQMRGKTDAPILFLTGKLDEDSKIQGLMNGADDYIAKPCSLPELEARVVANIRRSSQGAQTTKPLHLSIPPLEVDVVGHQAYCDGENLQLTGREYDILYLLATHKDQTVTYEQIALLMWGAYKEDDRRSVMVNVSRLRKKLESHRMLDGIVETVWGKGYKLTGRKSYG